MVSWQHHIARPCQINPAARIMDPALDFGRAAALFRGKERGAQVAQARGTRRLPCLRSRRRPAGAQSPADFYKGKTVELYIGYSVGGGYDLYARMLARHMGTAHPRQSRPWCQRTWRAPARLRLANWLYNVGPKDGTAFGIIGRGTGFDPLLGNKAAQFDATKFTWIGSANDEVSVCVAWHTSGVTKFDDLLTQGADRRRHRHRRPTPTSSRKSSTACSAPRCAIITGYPGGNDVSLAMERGEVQGRCGWSWSSVKSTHQKWCDEKKFNVLVQLSLEKHPDLPDVPLIIDLAKTDEQRQILRADLRAPGDGPAVPRAARRAGGARRRAAQGVHGHDEGQGLPRRGRKGQARDHAGAGDQVAEAGDGNLRHAAGDRAEGRRR